MEAGRMELDPCGQELRGEQNGQTVQTLADDQNVKPSADEIKKAKKREADKRCRDGKKQKLKDILRQLQNERAGHAKLKKKYAFLNGKLKQSQKDTAEPKMEDMERQSKKMKADYDELQGLHFYITGKLEQALADMEQIKEGYRLQQKIVKQQETSINMLQTLLAAAIEQQNAWKNMPQPPPPLSDGGLTPGADLFGSHGLNYTSPPGAAMVSSSSLMEGLLAPGRQLSWGRTPGNTFGTGEAGPSVHHPPVYPSGTTIRPEGPAIEYPPELSQSPLPQGWPRGNNSEQPTSYNADQSPGVD